MPFNVVIIGAGISGLATAINLCRDHHVVTVYEASPSLSEAGAGIQLPPNSLRLLDKLEIGTELWESSVEPKSVTLRKYSTGDIIKATSLVPQITQAFGSRYYLTHRVTFQKVLYETAVKSGARIFFDNPVVTIDETAPALTLKNGIEIRADLIIGADGIRSTTRQVVDHDSPGPQPSAYCAYRALVPRSSMLSSTLTAPLMSNIFQNVWLGPSSHLVGYPIGNVFSLVAVHLGETTLGRWTEPCNASELRTAFRNFDPVVRVLLGHVEKTAKWLLADLGPLRRWTSFSGRVTLVGDAAHAMLPFLAQGAAQAIEDASVLTVCLERASCSAEIPKLMAAYEQIRRPRVEKIAAATRENGELWHLVDEIEQNRRNEAMASGSIYVPETAGDTSETEEKRRLQVELSSGKLQAWIFAFDAVADARRQLDQMTILGSASTL